MYRCKHCDLLLVDCRCVEQGRLAPWVWVVRVLFVPEAFGPEMEARVAHLLNDNHPA